MWKQDFDKKLKALIGGYLNWADTNYSLKKLFVQGGKKLDLAFVNPEAIKVRNQTYKPEIIMAFKCLGSM